MRIGFDAKRLYNNFTGLGNHSRTTIDILTDEFPEHEYFLYTPKVRLNDVTEPYLSKIGCHTMQPHGVLRGSAWRTYGIVNNLKRDGIDLYHGLSNEMPVGLFHSGVASVVTIHDVAFRTFPDMYHWHDRLIYDQKWRYACNHADRIICISECTKRDVMNFYNVPGHKIDVVYQPVNNRYYEKREFSPAEEPYMLYVGSVNSRKNLLGAVKALEMMPKDLQILLVVVGGGGSYMNQVKEYVSQHAMDHLVKWEGSINGDALHKLYANAQLFVYPSFYEGFGLPVVEAQLCGCPVVTSNVSSLPEAGGTAALKADPHSVEEIRDCMLKALTDSDFRTKIIAEGREYAMKTFHPSVLARQLMQTYEKAMG